MLHQLALELAEPQVERLPGGAGLRRRRRGRRSARACVRRFAPWSLVLGLHHVDRAAGQRAAAADGSSGRGPAPPSRGGSSTASCTAVEVRARARAGSSAFSRVDRARPSSPSATSSRQLLAQPRGGSADDVVDELARAARSSQRGGAPARGVSRVDLARAPRRRRGRARAQASASGRRPWQQKSRPWRWKTREAAGCVDGEVGERDVGGSCGMCFVLLRRQHGRRLQSTERASTESAVVISDLRMSL